MEETIGRTRVPAVFARGGTSKAILFKASDLPTSCEARDDIFRRALGSPDPYGRQLNGLGGGLSSLSKIVIVEPSTRPDADVDYTFAQVAVDTLDVDYAGTCGNMSSAVGPFAVDEGLITPPDGNVTVRVFSTNTGKLYEATFEVRNGQAVETGDFKIPGVAGNGARIRLDYLDPGGAKTGRLLPTGRVIDTLTVDGVGEIAVSMVDATNPVAFVAADTVGLAGTIMPAELDAMDDAMGRLDRIRRAAGVAMGLGTTAADVARFAPLMAVVSPPAAFKALDGRSYGTGDMHLTLRMISMGNAHRAVPLTGAMCTAVAAKLPGSVVADMVAGLDHQSDLFIGNPSGALPVNSDVTLDSDGNWQASRATVYRTQRRLMEGWVCL